MICRKCNTENSDNSKFCAGCGAMLEAEAPATAAEAAPMFCPNCGEAVSAGTKFCGGCGASIGAAAPAPTPVMAGAPAPAEAPAPMAATAPSAVPMPVNDVPAPSAVPTPVNDAPVNAQNFGAAVAAQTAQPTQFQSGAAEAGAPQFTPTAPDNAAAYPAFDANSAAAVVAKPVKNGGKKALKIVLISVGALLVVGIALYFLFFRDFLNPMFMGNQGYAASIERQRIEYAMDSEAANTLKKNSDVLGAAIKSGFAASNGYDPDNYYDYLEGLEGGAASGMLNAGISAASLEEMISAYYQVFMETYGVNAVTMKMDADINLTDAGISALGLDGGYDINEILDYINNSELTMSFATAEDAIGGIVELKDGSGFTVNAKGVVYSDGKIAVMFPFGSDKCITMKLDDTGAVTETTTSEVEIDPAEAERLANAIFDIYLKHYEGAETTIENGEIFIGGTKENADIKASGRLISVTFTPEKISEMLAEVVEFIANDSYFTSKMVEAGAGAITEAEYKDTMQQAADSIRAEAPPVNIVVKTLVNFNGDVLGGGYDIVPATDSSAEYSRVAAVKPDTADTNVDAIGINYICNSKDNGFNLIAGGKEVACVIITEKSATDGTIRIEVGADGVTTGINIDYTGVKTEKYFNSELAVGTYDIYMAGTATSSPDGSMFRIKVENRIDGDTYYNTYSFKVSEFGDVTLNLSTKAYSDSSMLTIPDGAYDFGNPTEWNEEQSAAAGQYTLNMINELKVACEGSSSPLAQALVQPLGEAAASIEDSINPKADYEDIYNLANNVYDMMFDIMDKYEANEKYLSDNVADEMGSIYGELEKLYDTLYMADEMSMEDYEANKNLYLELSAKWDAVCATADKEVAEGKANEQNNQGQQGGEINPIFVGTWRAAEFEMYGMTFTAEELELEDYIIILNADGTLRMESGDSFTEGIWYSDNGTLTVVEQTGGAEYVTTFTFNGQYIITEADGVTMKFKK